MFKYVLMGMAPAVLLAGPAYAGDAVLYDADAPAWVKPADFEAALDAGEPLVILDKQIRLEDGVVSTYSDIAFRIENPEALTQLGTLKLPWLPDKGDLTVHRIEIVRDGEVIDLLAQGTRYDVLRRERDLEQRSIDGQLTATLSAPGLKVGDVLRFSQTITERDQALDGEVQASEGLRPEPAKAGLARVVVSWPEGDDMHWKFQTVGSAPEPTVEGGYKYLSIRQPVAKPIDMPEDAPARYKINPLMQVASFDGWRDVSKVMAPHFSTQGAIPAGGPLATQVAKIEAESDDQLKRASLALRIVQDEVSYLLNGMNGGNYLPQAPADTWANRYGDCKAKSLLLLAMLRAMGIESEVVLVRSESGDLVSQLLPSPGAFDHAIVRAVIGGTEYWLDGTSAGTRLDTIAEVPPFYYALPLREGGADLMPIEQRWPSQPDRIARITYDYSAGLDLPVTYDADITVRGIMGAQLRPQVVETDPKELRKWAAEYLQGITGEGVVYDVSVAYDEDSGLATVKAKGLGDSDWTWERNRGSFAFQLPSTDFEFTPDRARQAWRDIPVEVGGPLGFVEDVTLILPSDAAGYEIRGISEYDDVVAGVKINRSVSREGNRIMIHDDSRKIPSEVTVAELSAERAKAARLNSGDPVLRAPEGVTRYWEFADQDNKQRVQHLEAAYAAIIANDPTEAWAWSLRGALRRYSGNLDGAVADYTKAIALEPSVDLYFRRAALYEELGVLPKAIADARSAYGLDSQGSHAIYLAHLMAEDGKVDDALALLDPVEMSGDDRIGLVSEKSELLAQAGRVDEGWNLLEQMALERPGDGTMLNTQCWYMGTWNYHIDQAEVTCNEAVEALEYSAQVLDSRAMMYFRLGDTGKALRDLNAALASAPEQGASLYMRGIIRSRLGDAAGAKDVSNAKRLYRGIVRRFSRYGIEP